MFRYALERWRSDSCDVIVFHDGPLTDPQQATVTQLQAETVEHGGAANADIVLQDIHSEMPNSVGLLWEELSKQTEIQLPYVVIQTEIGNGNTINNWRAPLKDLSVADVVSSPARSTLTSRLLAGDSAVWLVLKSADEARSKATVELLNKQLNLLSEKIPLPEGIGLPGSELFSDIPLLMKFTVLEVDANDPREQYLVKLLKGFEPKAIADGEPMVVPVFGRGRALEVIPADQVDAGLIEDLTLFLCGACSCQVKERNPGFDLLLSANWDAELFGEDASAVTSQFAANNEDTGLPVLLTIPSGKSERAAVDASTYSASVATETQPSLTEPSTRTQGSSLAWAIGLLALVVIGIALTQASRS